MDIDKNQAQLNYYDAQANMSIQVNNVCVSNALNTILQHINEVSAKQSGMYVRSIYPELSLTPEERVNNLLKTALLGAIEHALNLRGFYVSWITSKDANHKIIDYSLYVSWVDPH